jgi:2'-hydroxyisoflavone reductase
MHVLVLRGTRFVGRAVVDPQAETIIGDRTGDLTARSTRHWDAVVDVAAYDPAAAGSSHSATRPECST